MSRLSRWLRSNRIVKTDGFEYLRYSPSGRQHVEQIGGRDFRIDDGPTFCASYQEIFTDEVYRFRSATPAPRIVDCGANCGLSVLYFKTLYPRAQIVAVEADPEIYRTLEWNVAQWNWSDVTLLNKAVATGGSDVTFYREGADAGRIHPLPGALAACRVPVVELDQLLTEPTELLKIDIEGAETDVLAACERLDMVSQLFVEYHSFVDAEQSLHIVLEKLSAAGFRYYLHTQFCPRQPLCEDRCHIGMDLQMNVFAKRVASRAPDPVVTGASANGILRGVGQG